MSALATALRAFLVARPSEIAVALVGGIAVSTRTEPRFTRDLDFAVAVADDAAAEAYVWRLRQAGYQLGATIEQVAQGRLSTARLRFEGRGPVLDLLFAASGIEPEVVAGQGRECRVSEAVRAPQNRVAHEPGCSAICAWGAREGGRGADVGAGGRVRPVAVDVGPAWVHGDARVRRGRPADADVCHRRGTGRRRWVAAVAASRRRLFTQ